MAAAKTPYSIDHRLLFPNGRVKYVHEQCETVFDAEGKPLLSRGSVQDVTDRKLIENELFRSREEWMETFNLMPDLIAVLDDKHRIVRVNKAMADRLHLPAEAAAGLPCYSCVHDAQAPHANCPHSMMLCDHQSHMMEVREPGLGGDFLVSVTPIFDESGNLKGGIHVARDITDRKRREEALRRYNRMLIALGNSSQAMMRARSEQELLADVCKIVVNDCGHAMVWVGYAENDEAKTVRPIASAGFEEGYLGTLNITWADTERGRGPTGTAIRTGKMCACRNMHNDPAFLPWREEAVKRGYASSIVVPLVAEGATFGAITIYSREADAFADDEARLLTGLANDLSHGIAAIREATARAQAEKALRKITADLVRSNRDLEQFAYVASHDLQEPLRAVAGFMSILSSKHAEKLDKEAKSYIEWAVDGAERMQRLIHDLLAFSRVGTRGAEFKPVSMRGRSRRGNEKPARRY